MQLIKAEKITEILNSRGYFFQMFGRKSQESQIWSIIIFCFEEGKKKNKKKETPRKAKIHVCSWRLDCPVVQLEVQLLF